MTLPSALAVFALYLPAGCALSADAVFEFPAFLNSSGLAVVVDEETGVIYLSGCAFYVPADETASAGKLSNVGNLPMDFPTPGIVIPSVGSGAEEPAPPEPPEEPEEPLHLADRYATEDAIEKYGYDFMDWFVNVVVNRIESQAVTLLLDAFPAYREAQAAGELGQYIGMMIYDAGEGEEMGDALGYVQRNYSIEIMTPEEDDVDSDELHMTLMYYIGVNTNWFAVWDEGSETWNCDGVALHDLENTFTHEMMHAFMTDYIPEQHAAFVMYWLNDEYGMEFEDYAAGFPLWFTEGAASTVDNVFEFRKHFYYWLREEETGLTNQEFLRDRYESAWDQVALTAQTSCGAYGMGALAVYYLCGLANGTDNLGGGVV